MNMAQINASVSLLSKEITYEVRFICYQYNSGAADNGPKEIVKSFDTLKRAIGFEKKVLQALEARNSECDRSKSWAARFVENFVWAGFIEKYQGIFQVDKTTSKVKI